MPRRADFGRFGCFLRKILNDFGSQRWSNILERPKNSCKNEYTMSKEQVVSDAHHHHRCAEERERESLAQSSAPHLGGVSMAESLKSTTHDERGSMANSPIRPNVISSLGGVNG